MPFVCLKMSHVQKWKVFLIYLFICEKAKMKLTKCTTSYKEKPIPKGYDLVKLIFYLICNYIYESPLW